MAERPHPADVLARLGHTATSADLVAVTGRRQLRTAAADGSVVRVTRGRYALPDFPNPRLAAAQMHGVVSHASAAQLLGLDVMTRTERPHVTVPRHRKRRPSTAILHWVDLRPSEVADGLTSPLRTVLDCARSMPFPEALAVADSALRLNLIGRSAIVTAAETSSGQGRGRLARVCTAADGRAGSGLESVLRGTLIAGHLRNFVPQVSVRDGAFFARVDLGDERLRIVLEADSFEHHGFRAALARDCRRYDELAIRGWLVLRFAWEHVMFEPDWVVATARAAVTSRLLAARRTGITASNTRLAG